MFVSLIIDRTHEVEQKLEIPWNRNFNYYLEGLNKDVINLQNLFLQVVEQNNPRIYKYKICTHTVNF